MNPPSMECQLRGLPRMSERIAPDPLPAPSLGRRLRLFLKRTLNSGLKRRLKRLSNRLLNARVLSKTKGGAVDSLEERSTLNLKAGTVVRVKTLKEIQATLSFWKELKGCGFLREMWPYCGTTQRVLKPVERFVDERDYQVKQTRGVVLLEGAICQGTELYGRCDRSCFYFWREEWLEEVEQKGGNA